MKKLSTTMSSSSLIFLLFALLVVPGLSACGGGSSTGSKDAAGLQEISSDSVSQDAAGSTDLLIDELGSGTELDTLPDSLDTTAQDPFAQEELPSLLPACDSTEPAPADAAGMAAFIGQNAVSLRDGEDWNFDIFVDQMARQRILMMGEVHGSKEIGTASADLMEALVRERGVNTIVLEIGMDGTDAMNDYVRTGNDAAGSPIKEFGFDMYSEAMFRKSLPRRARQLYEEGFDIHLVGVDSPQRLAWVNEQLTAMAQTMSAEAAAIIMDTMPAALEMADYGFTGIKDAYVVQARTYKDKVLGKLDQLCAELDEAGCERLEFLAYGLYIGALFNSESFMMAAMSGQETQELMDWMKEREELIFYNFRIAMEAPETRVYAHMGAAHTSKGDWNVAAMMQDDYEPTVGRVYTTTPAWGEGSKIFYGISTQNLPASPTMVASALSQLPEDNYFLATHNPGEGCVANPMSEQALDGLEGTYGGAYDAFFWFRVLTPDTPSYFKPGLYLPALESQWERTLFADELLSRHNRIPGGSL